MLGNLLITPYGEFNHFPKNAPQERGPAGQLPASWGKAGECDKLPDTLGEISSFPHLPQLLPRNFPKEIAGCVFKFLDMYLTGN